MAKQKPPANHHYVPRMLLKRFTDGNGQLWVFNKACPERGVQPVSVGSVFFEKHRYSIIGADGSKDPSPENYMSPIEGEADRLIGKLVEVVRNGQVPVISASEHRAWNEFVRVQWLRRPDIMATNMSDEEFNTFLDASIDRLAPVLKDKPDIDMSLVRDPRWRNRLRRNLAAQLVTQPLEAVERTLSQMGLAIAVLRKPNKSFITGSHPLIRCAPPGGGRLGTPGVEIWLAVSRDVAISPIPTPGEVYVLDDITDAQVRQLNTAVFNQSREIAGCSYDLVASIANVRHLPKQPRGVSPDKDWTVEP